MQNIFFFQTQQIHDNTNLFDQLKKQNIFYSYFKVDQNYYLFVYAEQSIDINLLYQSVEIIQELDYKQRKIRSFRGFFLYALEILENGKDYEILQTNLQPFFWRKVKNIIRQNKKSALQEFLFGKNDDSKLDNQTSNPRIKILEDQIQNFSNQVDSLQQKIIQLEHNQNILRETNLNVFSEPSKIDFKTSSNVQNIKGLNESNFITLSKIPEQEIIKIIQKGFQLNQEQKISLKGYYESKEQYSLFQFKGYSIKYETIRRTNLYKQFKVSYEKIVF